MKIAELRLTGLAGGTVEGGWAAERVSRLRKNPEES